MKRLILLLVLLPGMALAAVYKSTNERGEVVYSDQPTPGAEKLKLPALPTYKPPPLPKLSPGTPEKKTELSPYDSLSIVEPKNDATVRNNLGVLQVRVSIKPALLSKAGHKIQFYLDGQPYGTPITNTTIGFSNLDRGTHTLSASVLDSAGQPVMSASEVTFHMHRESIYNPNNPNNPNRPPPTPPAKPKPTPLPRVR
jgi:hypothetical protein